MARRSKKRGDWLEAACAAGAAVGFFTGLQWPGKAQEKLYAAVAGAFLGAVLVLALSLWLTRPKKLPFYESSFDRSVEPGSWAKDPWPKDEVDQYPMWREASERAAQNSARKPETSKWTIELLRALEWHRIELLAKAYFESLGIKAELTPFGPDGGVDIKLYSNDSAKPRAFVQCKAQAFAINVKAVRELYGVMSAQGVSEGI